MQQRRKQQRAVHSVGCMLSNWERPPGEGDICQQQPDGGEGASHELPTGRISQYRQRAVRAVSATALGWEFLEYSRSGREPMEEEFKGKGIKDHQSCGN